MTVSPTARFGVGVRVGRGPVGTALPAVRSGLRRPDLGAPPVLPPELQINRPT